MGIPKDFYEKEEKDDMEKLKEGDHVSFEYKGKEYEGIISLTGPWFRYRPV